jgi:hypothetical protein
MPWEDSTNRTQEIISFTIRNFGEVAGVTEDSEEKLVKNILAAFQENRTIGRNGGMPEETDSPQKIN